MINIDETIAEQNRIEKRINEYSKFIKSNDFVNLLDESVQIAYKKVLKSMIKYYKKLNKLIYLARYEL